MGKRIPTIAPSDTIVASVTTQPEKRPSPFANGNPHRLTDEERFTVRERIASWVFTPEPYRSPKTLKDLAQDLHISYRYARIIKDSIPKHLEDYLAQCEMQAVSQYGKVCRTLAKAAADGDLGAAKIIQSQMIEPRKKRSPIDQRPKTSLKAVTEAFRLLPVVKKREREEKEQTDSKEPIQ